MREPSTYCQHFNRIASYALRMAVLSVAALLAACSSSPVTQTPSGLSTLSGWRNCTTDNCGRNFISAYSTFVFEYVDDKPVYSSPILTVSPGRHWVEAHYSWGIGVLIGIGNYRNYGFELDFLPDHQYEIKEVPSGCIAPASRYRVSAKTLRVEDRGPTGNRQLREINAMEYCSPSGAPGTCKKDSDCRSGNCTSFGGATGFGLCGVLQD